MKIVLYGRQGCHLCDDAAALFERLSLAYDEVDIDRDPRLVELYNCCVPVVEIDGRVRFRGRVNELLLRRLVAGKVID